MILKLILIRMQVFKSNEDHRCIECNREWASVSNAAHDNAGLARLDIENNPPAGKDTDWQKQIYHTAPVQNYTQTIAVWWRSEL